MGFRVRSWYRNCECHWKFPSYNKFGHGPWDCPLNKVTQTKSTPSATTTDKPMSYAEVTKTTPRQPDKSQQDKWDELITPNKSSRIQVSQVTTPIETSNPFEALAIEDFATFNIPSEQPVPIRTSTPKGKRTNKKRKMRSPASGEQETPMTQKPRKHKLEDSLPGEPLETIVISEPTSTRNTVNNTAGNSRKLFKKIGPRRRNHTRTMVPGTIIINR
ncbi:hypothetical protein ACJMK2_021044 [Sinanodonta woodiana]|uniref:Uncharacterized protein n=1 Tax=Sinanodonta woodiana TaxID=1069815 RepID=A0ABD3U2P8_SINWO